MSKSDWPIHARKKKPPRTSDNLMATAIDIILWLACAMACIGIYQLIRGHEPTKYYQEVME